MRSKIKEENDGMSPKEITSEVGRLWRIAKDSDEIDKYTQLALEDKKRYTEEKSKFSDNSSSDDEKPAKPVLRMSSTSSSDSESEKTADHKRFLAFCKKTRKDMKNEDSEGYKIKDKKELKKEFKSLWGRMDDSEKEEYGN